jgi:hypothetical protein
MGPDWWGRRDHADVVGHARRQHKDGSTVPGPRRSFQAHDDIDAGDVDADDHNAHGNNTDAAADADDIAAHNPDPNNDSAADDDTKPRGVAVAE